MKKAPNTTPADAKPPEAGNESNDNVARHEFRKPTKISFESDMALEEAVVYFQAVVNGLRKGALEFRRGTDTLSLNPSSRVNVEVKASGKGLKEKVTFELSWVVETPPDFEIT